MSTTFRPFNPDQLLILPPNMAEWLLRGHLAHFISETVEELDTEAFYERYEGDGRRRCPYEPKMMLKLMIYGYATGVFSSRQIAKKAEEDVASRGTQEAKDKGLCFDRAGRKDAHGQDRQEVKALSGDEAASCRREREGDLRDAQGYR